MKFHFKAAGTDIIPNKRVWFALPSLLKVQYARSGWLGSCQYYWHDFIWDMLIYANAHLLYIQCRMDVYLQ